MKKLIIIGAGGFAREIYNLSMQLKEYQKDFVVKGFIDDNINALDTFNNYPKILSRIDDYIIEKDDVFVCAIANLESKTTIINKFISKGANFINLIHPTVRISSETIIGKGVIIADYSTISCDCEISDFVSIHSFVCVGHDVKIGKFSNIYSFTFFGGNVSVGERVNVYTRATIIPQIKIGNNSTVGSSSLVIRNVKDNFSVFGIPAVKI